VERASSLVASYLSDDNFLVRYQAVWFLGCWGKLRGYLADIIRVAQIDIELDNKAFAARCAGQVLKSKPDANAVKVLLKMILSEAEDAEVRTAAYSALLYAFYGEDGRARARDFEPTGTKSVEDFDRGLRYILALISGGLGRATTSFVVE
jgi:HEAT repeat protein